MLSVLAEVILNLLVTNSAAMHMLQSTINPRSDRFSVGEIYG
jgi:hypothetical protein